MVRKHPEKRRVPILCGMCETNETTRGRGVCMACQETYDLGRAAQKVLSRTDAKRCLIYRHEHSYDVESYPPGMSAIKDRNRSNASLVELITKLTGVPVDPDRHYKFTREKLRILKQAPNKFNPSYCTLFLTDEQADVVERFIKALDLEFDKVKKSAYRSGSHMINLMASGELSIDDVNKMAIKREQGE